MSKLLCWMFDHDRMMTSWRRRVCMRCGRQETLRNLGHVLAWEEVTTARAPASRA
jgi:hypothetical protein